MIIKAAVANAVIVAARSAIVYAVGDIIPVFKKDLEKAKKSIVTITGDELHYTAKTVILEAMKEIENQKAAQSNEKDKHE